MIECNTKLCVGVILTVLSIAAVSVAALSVREFFDDLPQQVGNTDDPCNTALGQGYWAQTSGGTQYCTGKNFTFVKDMEFRASLGSLGNVNVQGDVFVKHNGTWVNLTEKISQINKLHNDVQKVTEVNFDLPSDTSASSS